MGRQSGALNLRPTTQLHGFRHSRGMIRTSFIGTLAAKAISVVQVNLENQPADCGVRLTVHTDYALRLLMYLALKAPEPATIAEVAGRLQVSRNHLMKVVSRLATGGYIRTLRGKSGGLRLSRPAPDIRVGDVVRSSETNMHLVPCFSDETVCALLPACDLRHALEEASDAFAQILDRYSIGDLTANRGPLRALLSMPRESRRISSWPTKKGVHRAVSNRGRIASTADDNR